MAGLVVELLRRSEVRPNSSKGTCLRSSLQCLDNNGVLLLLESILQSSKERTQKVNEARGLRAVWEHLMYGCGYIDFEEAYHLYSSFSHLFCPDKQAFNNNNLYLCPEIILSYINTRKKN